MRGRKPVSETRNWRPGACPGSCWPALRANALILICMFSLACGGQKQKEKVFATPQEAVKALTEAAKAGNQEELKTIFGPNAEEVLLSGDPVADRQNREVIAAALRENWKLRNLRDDAKELEIGNEGWPFPIPIVKEASGWRFDTMAGKEEILTRRIGRNELTVIDACRTYVKAQQLYASRAHDGQSAGAYAQRISSSPGRQDGLYWPVKRGEPYSPLGEFFAQATGEGYTQDSGGQPRPFHGYLFRILTAQGKAAPGGVRSYLVNGVMTGGFALVAWPAEYSRSGVMTFVVNQDGVIYEKDLGPETGGTIKAMTAYDPDQTWSEVS